MGVVGAGDNICEPGVLLTNAWVVKNYGLHSNYSTNVLICQGDKSNINTGKILQD